MIDIADANVSTGEERILLAEEEQLTAIKIRCRQEALAMALSHLVPEQRFAFVLRHGLCGTSAMVPPTLQAAVAAKELSRLAEEWGLKTRRPIEARAFAMFSIDGGRLYTPRGQGALSQRQIARLLEASEAKVSRLLLKAWRNVSAELKAHAALA